MSNEEIHPPEPAEDPTLQQTVTLLKSSLGDYANTRKELAAIEVQEALANTITKAISIAVMALCGLFGYLLFLVAIISFAAKLLDKYTQVSMGRLWEICDPWIFLTLVASVIHIIVLLTFFDRLSRASKQKLFTHTVAEIKHDLTWLEQNKTTNEN